MEELTSLRLGGENHTDFNYHDKDLLHKDGKFFVADFYYHSDSNTLEILEDANAVLDWLEENNVSLEFDSGQRVIDLLGVGR